MPCLSTIPLLLAIERAAYSFCTSHSGLLLCADTAQAQIAGWRRAIASDIQAYASLVGRPHASLYEAVASTFRVSDRYYDAVFIFARLGGVAGMYRIF